MYKIHFLLKITGAKGTGEEIKRHLAKGSKENFF